MMERPAAIRARSTQLLSSPCKCSTAGRASPIPNAAAVKEPAAAAAPLQEAETLQAGQSADAVKTAAAPCRPHARLGVCHRLPKVASQHAAMLAAALCAGAAAASVPAHAASTAAGMPTAAAVPVPGGTLAEGFVQGLLLIFFSELGDKTFFLALLLAASRPKGAVFAGTFGALAVMTVISVVLGQVLHQLDELNALQATGVPWDDVLAVVLLLAFGVQTLREAKNAEQNAADERGEAQEAVDALGAGAGVALSTFALVFAAEWGDKSFLATIALSAATSPLGVTLGAITGHGAATLLAILGGGFLSRSVRESTLQYSGGVLFLVFAAVSAVEVVQKVSSA